MASLCIADKDDALQKVGTIVEKTKDIQDETQVLFGEMEELGNSISPGLQGFVPRLKEMLPLLGQLTEAAEKAQTDLRDLIDKDDQINSIQNASLE